MLLLQVREMTSLVVNIHDLLMSLLVEGTQLPARGSIHRLVKVGAQAIPRRLRTLGDLVLVVHGLGFLRRMILVVKVLQGLREPRRYSMLFVKINAAGNHLIADAVAVCQVFGENPSAWLLLLWNFLDFLGLRFARLFWSHDTYLYAAELGVVEEKGCLGCGFFLERHGC